MHALLRLANPVPGTRDNKFRGHLLFSLFRKKRCPLNLVNLEGVSSNVESLVRLEKSHY